MSSGTISLTRWSLRDGRSHTNTHYHYPASTLSSEVPDSAEQEWKRREGLEVVHPLEFLVKSALCCLPSKLARGCREFFIYWS